MFQTKFVQKIKTHFKFNNFFFRQSCRLWDNVEKHGKAREAVKDVTTRRIRIACWITKATDTRSEYVTFMAFPGQQWLHKCASVLRYRPGYIACLVSSWAWQFSPSATAHKPSGPVLPSRPLVSLSTLSTYVLLQAGVGLYSIHTLHDTVFHITVTRRNTAYTVRQVSRTAFDKTQL
jgi:hypothetical protein